eukprot:scaffold126213_cov66-Phaeocystis_antarctica.AAC.1
MRSRRAARAGPCSRSTTDLREYERQQWSIGMVQNGHFWLRCSHSSMQAQQQLCPHGAIVTGSHMTSRQTEQVIRSSSITPAGAAGAAGAVGAAGAAGA